jgi:hypothetical protein
MLTHFGVEIVVDVMVDLGEATELLVKDSTVQRIRFSRDKLGNLEAGVDEVANLLVRGGVIDSNGKVVDLTQK